MDKPIYLYRIETDLNGYLKAKRAGYRLNLIVDNTTPLGTHYKYMMVKPV